MKTILTALVCLGLWFGVSLAVGSALVPSPFEVLAELGVMLGEALSWRSFCISIFRGIAGLGIAAVAAIVLGGVCGLSKRLMELLSPLISGLQSCPTIVWVTLLMVWVGVGSVIPVAAVAVATFPILFFNTASGVAALDRRLFAAARVYQVSPWRVFRELVVPGVMSYVAAGLSFALGICWKVTSMAEFIASESGIGAQIYWSYRTLNIPRLFSWALILILLGISLDRAASRPLRKKSRKIGAGRND